MFLCFQAQKIGHQSENWWPKYRCKKLTYLIIEKSPPGFRSCLLCFKQAGWWPSGLLLFRIFYFSAPASSFASPHAPHIAPLSAFSSGVGLFCDGEPSARHRANVGLKMCESSLFTRGFTHFGSFRGKKMAPEPKIRCLYIFLFHFAPLFLWPPAYEFCGFSQKRGHRSPCDFTVEKWPRPPVGKKKSEPTHYQMHQFAQNNTYSDVFQSLLSIQRSPIYHTFMFFVQSRSAARLHQTVLLEDILRPHHPIFHTQLQLTFRKKNQVLFLSVHLSEKLLRCSCLTTITF